MAAISAAVTEVFGMNLQDYVFIRDPGGHVLIGFACNRYWVRIFVYWFSVIFQAQESVPSLKPFLLERSTNHSSKDVFDSFKSNLGLNSNEITRDSRLVTKVKTRFGY